MFLVETGMVELPLKQGLVVLVSALIVDGVKTAANPDQAGRVGWRCCMPSSTAGRSRPR